MRIFVLSNEFHPLIIGGLGIVATELTQRLVQDPANEVTVLTKGHKRFGQVKRHDNLKVVRFPRHSNYTSRTHFFPEPILNWLREQGTSPPELLHVHSVQCQELALLLQSNWNIPLVYSCHSLVRHERSSLARDKMAKRQELLFTFADRITAPSAWLQQEIGRPEKTTVIPNGVILPPETDRRRAPLDQLLFVGRLVRDKGIEELLHALALLRQTEPRVRLTVVGGGAERYTLHLHSLCERLGVTGAVRWLGPRTHREVQRAYRTAGALVLPSRSESFGLVALEALAAGIPLVSTQSGGLQHSVNETTATLIPAVAPQTIADAIRSMWQDPERTAARREAGRKLAGEYDWTKIAFRYGALFQALIAERGSRNA
ncbi:glycogen(starch) synthase [Tumebacillus sp. BK434]|uniref:glycosyltransferase family 4 protein n=1 Tax=Tumebacillus sp. BK434 TaxID=2512169 RepID=UPI001043045E|nr:glycosyltransferase family 4 protein [Tumebacillus sp. BK434]TCP59217.1 glycogen(starch) synthase [Tumebacillus sp. BK434]